MRCARITRSCGSVKGVSLMRFAIASKCLRVISILFFFCCFVNILSQVFAEKSRSFYLFLLLLPWPRLFFLYFLDGVEPFCPPPLLYDFVYLELPIVVFFFTASSRLVGFNFLFAMGCPPVFIPSAKSLLPLRES